MSPWRKKLLRNPLIKFLASIRITVVCLIWLFILTFWGTLAQVDQGLFVAQERFFNSWTFLVFDFLPLPGGQLTLWILFLNLLVNSLVRFVYRWSHSGITVIHIGLLLYFISAFITFHVAEESNVTLKEGESKNVSQSYFDWELSFWPQTDENYHEVTAINLSEFQDAEQFFIEPLSAEIEVVEYYPNAKAYTAKPRADLKDYLNVSGIQYVESAPLEKEPEKNFPAGIFKVRHDNKVEELILYGKEINPTQIKLNEDTYNLQLRRKRFELPFVITLNKFEKEMHPGTETARAFRSFVTIEHADVKRDTKIFMNNPLRFKDYTLYQASYAINQKGEELSTLAVVKNSGRLLPYISCGVVTFGLILHFILMAFGRFKIR